ncbi:hypothetical protein ABK040_005329 [Willaertia magna]
MLGDKLTFNPIASVLKSETNPIKRKHVEHSTESKSLFLLANKNFEQQFSKLYFNRIAELKPPLLKKLNKLFPNTTHAKTMLELTHGVTYSVVGTLYKEMKLKPNILRDFTMEKTMGEDSSEYDTLENCVSETDFLILEDSSGSRCNVVFENRDSELNKTMTNQLISGIIVGAVGKIDSHGTFIATDFVFNDPAPQRPLKVKEESYIAVISGINCGDSGFDYLRTQLAFDFLGGLLGDFNVQSGIVSKITRVIVAGNSVAAPTDKSTKFDVRGSLRPKDLQSIVGFMNSVDSLLEGLASTIDVDILPGAHDPSNVTIPQQPIHPCMLPKSSNLSTCHLVTNPHIFKEDSADVYVSSGQTIEGIERYVTSSRLEVMENTLKWGHYAPSAPDTLKCYPFETGDPFIIKQTPHIYICGNSKKFETKLCEFDNVKVRLVAVPAFTMEPTIALVNIKTLECHPVHFNLNVCKD